MQLFLAFLPVPDATSTLVLVAGALIALFACGRFWLKPAASQTRS